MNSRPKATESEDVYRPHLVLRNGDCPGIVAFLRELPFRSESAFLRGIIYPWYLHHMNAGTLDTATKEAIRVGMSAHLGVDVDTVAVTIAGRPTAGAPRGVALPSIEEPRAAVLPAPVVAAAPQIGYEATMQNGERKVPIDDFDLEKEAKALGVLGF